MATSSIVDQAKSAIERGDYGKCLSYLEPLSKKYPLGSEEGANIRMLMITAWMGQGLDQKAISTCKLLTKINDPKIRQQAKQLISILEAPNLPRPKNWSIQIPNLDLTSNTWASTQPKIYKQKSPKKPPSHPPTGPTKAFDLSFSTLVILVFILLTILLSR